MLLEFASPRLKRECETFALARRRWGEPNAKKIFQRLGEIQAASSLQALMKVPAANCHPLIGDRKGQFAVHVKQPYRLIFEPAGGQVEANDENRVNFERVKAVRILEVEDYHG